VRKFKNTHSAGGRWECIWHGRPNTDYCGYCSARHTGFRGDNNRR